MTALHLGRSTQRNSNTGYSRYRENACRLFVALKTLLKRYGLYGLGAFIALFAFSSRFTLGVNVTESLPHTLYLIDKGNKEVSVGDFVAFTWALRPESCRHLLRHEERLTSEEPACMPDPIPAGVTLIKEVRGVAGDVVDIRNGYVVINGSTLSRIKSEARDGTPLLAIEPGVIGEGELYVHADHVDSLDSRYRIPGLVRTNQIKGKAYPLF